MRLTQLLLIYLFLYLEAVKMFFNELETVSSWFLVVFFLESLKLPRIGK